jgi:dephospho-CoA kinase
MAQGSADHPYTVALTGGIASGKTLVSDEFSKLGVPVIDTDVIAHRIVEPGQPALLDIEAVFGPSVIDESGRLRRRAMREIIFSDRNAQRKLESILHPLIRQEVAREIASVETAYCILVIPLLAEHGAYPNVDRILVVDVDPEVQIERLMSRDNSDRHQAEKALASQASRAQRLAIADDVLPNSASPEQARLEVARLHEKYTNLAME